MGPQQVWLFRDVFHMMERSPLNVALAKDYCISQSRAGLAQHFVQGFLHLMHAFAFVSGLVISHHVRTRNANHQSKDQPYAVYGPHHQNLLQRKDCQ